jgi:hypothetical protein
LTPPVDGPGGILRDVEHTHGAVRLTELHRFADPAEAAAFLALSNGAAAPPLRVSSFLPGRYASGTQGDAFGDLHRARDRTSLTEQPSPGCPMHVGATALLDEWWLSSRLRFADCPAVDQPDTSAVAGPRSGNGLDQESLPCPVVRWEAPLTGGRYPASPSGEASHDAESSELVNIRSKNRYSVSVLATGPTASQSFPNPNATRASV